MKLVVLIPAFNEEKSIDWVIRGVPRKIGGINEVEVLIVNDGSTDRTFEVAKEAGADKIISLKKNMGLAHVFRVGSEAALKMGADIMVGIDADGQYDPLEIPKLIEPIINGKADIVLGSRFKGNIEHMNVNKKYGNMLASFIVKRMSGLPISDAQTGFRAFSRDAVLRLNVLSDYTYVQETIIQAANNKMIIKEIPIAFKRRQHGSSRLISNVLDYARRAGLIMLRTYRDYRPLRTFAYVGVIFLVLGVIVGFRPLINFLLTGEVGPFLPSAILTALLILIGINAALLGLLADALRSQRAIQDEILYKLKKMELDESKSR